MDTHFKTKKVPQKLKHLLIIAAGINKLYSHLAYYLQFIELASFCKVCFSAGVRTEQPFT